MARPPQSLHDISMAFHDTLALPHAHPRPPAFLNALVLSPDLSASLPSLVSLALRAPHLLPPLVLALRRHHFPRFSLPSAHAPLLLHALVRAVPYFYRYIASPVFARALRRLALARTPAASHPALLLATWARDLAPHARARDPAAIFWISAYRRAKRAAAFQFSRPAHARFVCYVPPMFHTVRDDPALDRAAYRMEQKDVAATLGLLEQVVLAAKRERARPTDHSPQIPRRPRRPSRSPSALLKFNDKVLNVLKRHDDNFLPDPFDDSLTTLRLQSDRAGSSSVFSVAEIAKINARRKLSESQTSFTVSWVARSEEDQSTMERLHIEHPHLLDEQPVEDKAITPSTYAGIEIDEESGMVSNYFPSTTDDPDTHGDTVRLDGLDLSSTDANTNVAQKIFKYMAALAKRDQSNPPPSSLLRSASTDTPGESSVHSQLY